MGESETLSVPQAIAEIQRISGLRDALQRRNIGVTWMIFGIATVGIFVTGDFIGVLAGTGENVGWIFPFVWIPWVLMGCLATAGLWRSAARVFPGVGDRRYGRWRGLAFFVLSFAASML